MLFFIARGTKLILGIIVKILHGLCNNDDYESFDREKENGNDNDDYKYVMILIVMIKKQINACGIFSGVM